MVAVAEMLRQSVREKSFRKYVTADIRYVSRNSQLCRAVRKCSIFLRCFIISWFLPSLSPCVPVLSYYVVVTANQSGDVTLFDGSPRDFSSKVNVFSLTKWSF